MGIGFKQFSNGINKVTRGNNQYGTDNEYGWHFHINLLHIAQAYEK
ncbi:hypothetical protein GCM10027429_05590 [Marivirga atlantica]|jgi:hypothetical protein